MPSIVSPAPRRAIAPRPNHILQPTVHSRRFQLMSPPSSIEELPLATAPRVAINPPRLLSPIILNDPQGMLKTKSPSPCGSSSRRKGTARIARAPRRRRHPSRIDYPFDFFGHPSAFDQLTWIPALDSPPNFNPCDVADLSQIFNNDNRVIPLDATPASGPVRRRKGSLRSNPLASGPEPLSNNLPSRQIFQSHQFPDRTVPAICPRTPPPLISFDPHCIKFHNLMPIFP
ncbi:hypothetical protein BJ138DRAFT_1110060 [Hygrophoropsis aurantiaca]|uniref:Uncharacterized protein n=1 Tax=Hygrophoropsis aurantiaca TaxID=72124 RepID=A0ACB8APU6_9AGAM|nr:hypothetical protein BJ138DRAFT_1110060 [Hygrophoropsis aurantiaca]